MSHRPPAEWLLVALISLQGASVSQAQISRWQLGGSGLQWTGNDSISILVDTTPTAIRPNYLTPDQNVFAQLDNWSPRKFPRELGFVDGQRPRAWWLGFGSESTAYNATYLVDGDSTSYLPPNTEGRHDWFTFDLAVPVPAFRFGFFTPSQGFRSDGTPLSQDVVPAYEISIAPEADRVWLDSGSYQRVGRVIADVAENFSANVQIDFSRQYVRFVRWRRNPSSLDIDPNQTYGSDGGIALKGTIGDFELFAHGVPASALYLSAIIDLGQEVNFGRLSWSATPMRVLENGAHVEDPEARVWLGVEARTGRDSDPLVYHEFDNKGREVIVERARYEYDLKPAEGYVAGNRPGVRASIAYDTDNWTYWTTPITEPNRPLNLQSGSHIQLKLILHSADFDAYLRLDSLWVEQAPLLADRVLGEVARLDDMQPRRGFSAVNLGEQTDFAYDIGASFTDEVERGFDALRLSTGGRTVFKRLEMGQPLAPVEPRSVQLEDNALVVVLPRAVTAQDNAPVRVVFGTELFLFATTFGGEVFTADSQSLPQPIQPGDAAAAISTSSLRVLATDEKQSDSIQDLRFSTPVFTPNGDGIHERVEITYALFRLPEAAAVELRVFTLDGLLVAKSPLGDQSAGPQRVFWDGRATDGKLLPPGVYVLGITLQSETGAQRQLLPLGIAY